MTWDKILVTIFQISLRLDSHYILYGKTHLNVFQADTKYQQNACKSELTIWNRILDRYNFTLGRATWHDTTKISKHSFYMSLRCRLLCV